MLPLTKSFCLFKREIFEKKWKILRKITRGEFLFDIEKKVGTSEIFKTETALSTRHCKHQAEWSFFRNRKSPEISLHFYNSRLKFTEIAKE